MPDRTTTTEARTLADTVTVGPTVNTRILGNIL